VPPPPRCPPFLFPSPSSPPFLFPLPLLPPSCSLSLSLPPCSPSPSLPPFLFPSPSLPPFLFPLSLCLLRSCSGGIGRNPRCAREGSCLPAPKSAAVSHPQWLPRGYTLEYSSRVYLCLLVYLYLSSSLLMVSFLALEREFRRSAFFLLPVPCPRGFTELATAGTGRQNGNVSCEVCANVSAGQSNPAPGSRLQCTTVQYKATVASLLGGTRHPFSGPPFLPFSVSSLCVCLLPPPPSLPLSLSPLPQGYARPDPSAKGCSRCASGAVPLKRFPQRLRPLRCMGPSSQGWRCRPAPETEPPEEKGGADSADSDGDTDSGTDNDAGSDT